MKISTSKRASGRSPKGPQGNRHLYSALLVWGLCFLVAAWPVMADLTAVITPGYTFSQNEIPTTGKLNLLGEPSIQIFGTVGGSNGIAANSINGTMLFSGVVDGTSLDFNGSSPRQLEIAAAGVSAAKLNTNVAGAGLTGGAGNAISLMVDITNTIINASNQVTLNPTNWGPFSNTILGTSIVGGITNTNRLLGLGQGLQIQGTNLTVTNLSLTNLNWQTFTAANLALSAGAIVNTGHGLTNAAGISTRPNVFRAVVVNVSAENGYAIGDEVDIAQIFSTGGSSTPFAPIFIAGDNTTNVFMSMTSVSPVMWTKTASGVGAFTPTKWTGKIYCSVQ